MKPYRRIIILLLSISLVLLGSAQARSLACPQACPVYDPVMTMDCCDDDSPAMPVAMPGDRQHQEEEPVPCCHSELCPELLRLPENVVLNSQESIDSVVFQPPPSCVTELPFNSQPVEPLQPDTAGLRVSLYTLHCSFLN